MGNSFSKLSVLLLCLVIFSLLLPAQAGRGGGRLAGTVVNEKGDPVINAEVILEFSDGGLKDSTHTNKKGEWGFIGLGTGKATVTVAADDYLPEIKTVEIKQLELNPRLNIVLREDREKKIRLKDEESMQVLELGNQLYQQGKYPEALAVYREFETINPEVFIIHFNIGDCLREMKDHQGAAAAYEKALAGSREREDLVMQAKALAALGELRLRNKDLAAAQDFFRQSIELNPKDELLAFNVAEIFFASNQTGEAIKFYELAASIKPDWSEPLLKIAYAWLNQGDIPKAVDYLQRFLQIDPDSPQAGTVRNLLESLKKN